MKTVKYMIYSMGKSIELEAAKIERRETGQIIFLSEENEVLVIAPKNSLVVNESN